MTPMFLVIFITIIYKMIMCAACAFIAWRISRMAVTPTFTYQLIMVGWIIYFMKTSVSLFYLNNIVFLAQNFDLLQVISGQFIEFIALFFLLAGKLRIYRTLKAKFREIEK